MAELTSEQKIQTKAVLRAALGNTEVVFDQVSSLYPLLELATISNALQVAKDEIDKELEALNG